MTKDQQALLESDARLQDALRKLDDTRAELREAHDRISWLETQREVECQQKETALQESAECLKMLDGQKATLRRIEGLEKVLELTQDELNAANKAANELQMRLNDQGEDLERAGVRAGEQAEELYKANEYIKIIGRLLGSTCGDDTPEKLITELKKEVQRLKQHTCFRHMSGDPVDE